MNEKLNHLVMLSPGTPRDATLALSQLFIINIFSKRTDPDPLGRGKHISSLPLDSNSVWSMAPKNVFDHCAQTLRRRKLKLGDF